MTETKLKAHVYEELPVLSQFKCWKYFCLLFHDWDSVKNTEALLFTHHQLEGRRKNNSASNFDNIYVTNTVMQFKKVLQSMACQTLQLSTKTCPTLRMTENENV